ncbi:MAG: DUF4373 domain-containing protein [Clostridium sp.]|nr:DUF4373 domain-containing protein [Clostridium sp.]
MARPTKAGLDYFELDCQLEEKVRLIQAEYGLKGFAIVVKLYQKIYGELGYYCEWNDDSLLLFMSENGLPSDNKNLIQSIVDACIRRNIFSQQLFDKFGILTSEGIQKRYLNATSRREKVEMKKEYLLLSVGNNTNNVCINSINVNRNSVNVCSNSQSREEKSREDNNIVATPAEPKPATVSFQDGSFEIRCVDMIINSCLKTFPNSKVPRTISEKQKWAIEIDRMKRIDKRSEDDIVNALDYALTDSFWQTNIRSAKKFREKFETLIVQSRKNRNRGNIKNSFNNFTQNIYDFDELEKELLSN